MADDTHLYCGFKRFSSSRWLPCVRVVWSRVFLCVCAPFCFCCPIWSLVVFVPLLCFSSFLVLCCGCPCSAVLGRDLAVATASAGHGSVCFRLCVLSFPCAVLRPFSVLSVALYSGTLCFVLISSRHEKYRFLGKHLNSYGKTAISQKTFKLRWKGRELSENLQIPKGKAAMFRKTFKLLRKTRAF